MVKGLQVGKEPGEGGRRLGGCGGQSRVMGQRMMRFDNGGDGGGPCVTEDLWRPTAVRQ